MEDFITLDEAKDILGRYRNYWREVRKRDDISPLRQELDEMRQMLGVRVLWILAEYAERVEARQNAPDNPSDALAKLASAKMVEMNLTYGQAAEYVLKTDPALALAYREHVLNPTRDG